MDLRLEDFEPTCSPDGRYIAFSRAASTPGAADIWVMRSDGTRATDITPSSAGFDVAVTWTRDES